MDHQPNRAGPRPPLSPPKRNIARLVPSYVPQDGASPPSPTSKHSPPHMQQNLYESATRNVHPYPAAYFTSYGVGPLQAYPYPPGFQPQNSSTGSSSSSSVPYVSVGYGGGYNYSPSYPPAFPSTASLPFDPSPSFYRGNHFDWAQHSAAVAYPPPAGPTGQAYAPPLRPPFPFSPTNPFGPPPPSNGFHPLPPPPPVASTSAAMIPSPTAPTLDTATTKRLEKLRAKQANVVKKRGVDVSVERLQKIVSEVEGQRFMKPLTRGVELRHERLLLLLTDYLAELLQRPNEEISRDYLRESEAIPITVAQIQGFCRHLAETTAGRIEVGPQEDSDEDEEDGNEIPTLTSASLLNSAHGLFSAIERRTGIEFEKDEKLQVTTYITSELCANESLVHTHSRPKPVGTKADFLHYLSEIWSPLHTIFVSARERVNYDIFVKVLVYTASRPGEIVVNIDHTPFDALKFKDIEVYAVPLHTLSSTSSAAPGKPVTSVGATMAVKVTIRLLKGKRSDESAYKTVTLYMNLENPLLCPVLPILAACLDSKVFICDPLPILRGLDTLKVDQPLELLKKPATMEQFVLQHQRGPVGEMGRRPAKYAWVRSTNVALNLEAGFNGNRPLYTLRRFAANALNVGSVTEENLKTMIGHSLRSSAYDAYKSRCSPLDMPVLINGGKEDRERIEVLGNAERFSYPPTTSRAGRRTVLEHPQMLELTVRIDELTKLSKIDNSDIGSMSEKVAIASERTKLMSDRGQLLVRLLRQRFKREVDEFVANEQLDRLKFAASMETAFENTVESRILNDVSAEIGFARLSAAVDVDFDKEVGEYSPADALKDLANDRELGSGEEDEAVEVAEDDKAMDGTAGPTCERDWKKRRSNPLATEIQKRMGEELNSSDVGKLVEMLLEDGGVNGREMTDYPGEAADDEGKCRDCRKDCKSLTVEQSVQHRHTCAMKRFTQELSSSSPLLSTSTTFPCKWGRCKKTYSSEADRAGHLWNHINYDGCSECQVRDCGGIITYPGPIATKFDLVLHLQKEHDLVACSISRAKGSDEFEKRLTSYCSCCYTAVFGDAAYEEHVSQHLDSVLARSKLSPTALETHNNLRIVIDPGFCPVCLYDETLTSTARMMMFSSESFRGRHFNNQHLVPHLQNRPPPSSLTCPLPHCAGIAPFPDVVAYGNHFLALHSITVTKSLRRNGTRPEWDGRRESLSGYEESARAGRDGEVEGDSVSIDGDRLDKKQKRPKASKDPMKRSRTTKNKSKRRFDSDPEFEDDGGPVESSNDVAARSVASTSRPVRSVRMRGNYYTPGPEFAMLEDLCRDGDGEQVG